MSCESIQVCQVVWYTAHNPASQPFFAKAVASLPSAFSTHIPLSVLYNDRIVMTLNRQKSLTVMLDKFATSWMIARTHLCLRVMVFVIEARLLSLSQAEHAMAQGRV